VDQRPSNPGQALSDQVFVARQPILDRDRRVYAYELLFRDSAGASGSGTAASEATARVMCDAVVAFGLDTLTHGRPAFINITRDLLLEGIPTAFPPDRVVIELLETIEADDEVLAACRELRRKGYALALDDFVLTERTEALVPLADFIKVDFIGTDRRDARREIARCGREHQLALLAEKIESVEAFDEAGAEGFEYFQGYFFGRPVIHNAQKIPANQVSHFRLLNALQDPDLSVHKVERLVQHDASLCFRVLRTVNSAGFAQAARVDSIQQALVLMGVDTVRRWVSLWVLAGLSESAHPEVVDMASVRARCCELLMQRQAGPDAAAGGFLLGMCSLLDTILSRPMESVIEQLPLPAATQAALRGEDTPGRRVLECAMAYERGDWERVLSLATRAGLSAQALRVAHHDALRWSTEFLKAAP
jgi:c-di-GMP-related signal transduction protein